MRPLLISINSLPGNARLTGGAKCEESTGQRKLWFSGSAQFTVVGSGGKWAKVWRGWRREYAMGEGVRALAGGWDTT